MIICPCFTSDLHPQFNKGEVAVGFSLVLLVGSMRSGVITAAVIVYTAECPKVGFVTFRIHVHSLSAWITHCRSFTWTTRRTSIAWIIRSSTETAVRVKLSRKRFERFALVFGHLPDPMVQLDGDARLHVDAVDLSPKIYCLFENLASNHFAFSAV